MSQTARKEILEKLKSQPRVTPAPRPLVPPLTELSWSPEDLITHFIQNLTAQTGVVHLVKNADKVKEKLAEICTEEGLTTVMVSTDRVVAPLDLQAWGRETKVRVLTARDFPDREAYKNAVFTEVQAGITGADFGVAESGTLGLIHHKDQPRLISLAPILHIAILPVENLVATYEQATRRVFKETSNRPSQFTFTTGPSMTGDIQGGQFKGMHGPRRLTVILLG